MASILKPIARPARAARHFWETDDPPPLILPGEDLEQEVERLLTAGLSELMSAPFASRSDTRERTLARLDLLTRRANRFPVYEDRFSSAGVASETSLTWESFHRIRPVTKTEMSHAFGTFVADAEAASQQTYPTRSSGSSGHTLDIIVDEAAIAMDTAHGYRQLVLQSGLNYGPDDCVAHIYTVPWPVDEVKGRYVGHFLSSLLQPEDIVSILSGLRPDVLTLYPTTLESLLSRGHLGDAGLEARVAITHSEQSSPALRERWSKKLRMPVRDEYSSEEAARIALELPCGHYHTCDDAVHVEILDPVTGRAQEPGKIGVVVITNLLNMAMPFIRYVQGDLAIAGEARDCSVGWGCIEGIEGRRNDAFLNERGELLAAGALLDATYRAMFENRLSIDFELVQTSPSEVVFVHSAGDDPALPALRQTLADCLCELFGHRVDLISATTAPSARTPGKRRPIRRTFGAVEGLTDWQC